MELWKTGKFLKLTKLSPNARLVFELMRDTIWAHCNNANRLWEQILSCRTAGAPICCFHISNSITICYDDWWGLKCWTILFFFIRKCWTILHALYIVIFTTEISHHIHIAYATINETHRLHTLLYVSNQRNTVVICMHHNIYTCQVKGGPLFCMHHHIYAWFWRVI